MKNSNTPMQMLRKFLKHLFLIPFILFGNSAQAGHVAGSEITFRALDSFVFEVTYSVYRNCEGVAMSNITGGCKIVCPDSGWSESLIMNLKSITDISPVPPGTVCYPPNTYASGNGIEKHVFMDTVDLNLDSLSHFKTCCNIYFTSSLFGRAGNINTGSANANFYNHAYLNLCASALNSSPVFGFDAVTKVACAQPASISPGIIERQKGDSLSFSWLKPHESQTSSINYTTNCNFPITPFLPGTLPCSSTYPTSNPPIGFYLDPQTGRVVFTPVYCSELTVLVIEIKQWKKNSAGNMELLCAVRRDLLFTVNSSPSNNPPNIQVNAAYSLCVGEELCFDVVSTDLPATGSSVQDTTSLQWSGSVAGPEFTILNPDSAEKIGRFCWTPDSNDVRAKPYIVSFRARDNQPSLIASSDRDVLLTVNGKPSFTTQIDSLNCNKYSLQTLLDSASLIDSARHKWRILDTAGNALNWKYAIFSSSALGNSVQKDDTLKFKVAGTYIIEHQSYYNVPSCNTTTYDTVMVGNIFRINLDQVDTTVCLNSSMELNANTGFASGAVEYLWYFNGKLLDHDSDQMTLSNDSLHSKLLYELIATDDANCPSADHFSLEVKGIPDAPTLEDSIKLCDQSQISLNVYSYFKSVKWSTGSSNHAITVTSSGQYGFVGTDQYGCKYPDSTYVRFFYTVPTRLKDTVLCADSVVLDAGSYENYSWNTGDSTRYITKYSGGTFSVEVLDSNGCTTNGSSKVSLYPVLVPDFAEDISFCCDTGTINLRSLLGPNDANAGIWTNLRYPNSITGGYQLQPYKLCEDSISISYARYRYTNPVSKCSFDDSIMLTAYPTPELVLSNLSLCQKDADIDLNSEVLQSNLDPDGTQEWSCVNCNGHQIEDLLSNEGTVQNPEYHLNLDKSKYQMKNPLKDTLRFRLDYSNPWSCTNSAEFTIYLFKSPEAPQLNWDGHYIWVENSTGIPVQWYLDDSLLTGQNGDSIFVTKSALYSARFVHGPGCNSELSNLIDWLNSIEDFDRYFKVLPNPSTGAVSIQMKNLTFQIISLKVYDQKGREVSSTYSNEANINLDWTGEAGVYIIEIQTSAGVFRTSVIRI